MIEVLFLLCLTPILALSSTSIPISNQNFDMSAWDEVVRNLVVENETLNGIQLNTFNYANLTNNDAYKTFTFQVENAIVTQFNENQFKIFWINVYNYLAVRMIYKYKCQTDLVGDCRPLTSIRQIGEQQPSAFVSTVWDYPELTIISVNNGKKLSLNDIEHGKLRNPPILMKFDARIHACIVCASISCPNLRSRAYGIGNLNQEMDDSTREFLSNPKKGSAIIDNMLYISPIFTWFASDFSASKPRQLLNITNVRSFLNMYGPPSVIEWLGNHISVGDSEFKSFEYDWDLNGSVDNVCNVNRICFPWWGAVCCIVGLFIITIIIVLMVVIRRRRKEEMEIN